MNNDPLLAVLRSLLAAVNELANINYGLASSAKRMCSVSQQRVLDLSVPFLPRFCSGTLVLIAAWCRTVFAFALLLMILFVSNCIIGAIDVWASLAYGHHE